MLYAKDPRIGIGYNFDCGEPLRNADRHCDYDPDECSSCGAGIYDCGALLSGTIWDIWQLLEATEPDADDIIRSLVFASIPMHSGIGIDPSIAIDLVTLDDDDGLLENGTPHYAEICQGFAMHAMSCPPLEDGLVVQGANYETRAQRWSLRAGEFRVHAPQPGAPVDARLFGVGNAGCLLADRGSHVEVN